MSGDYVDQLARRLATPTTRRRSLGLFAAGAVALATPLRPRLALAQAPGEIVCTPATEDCLEHVCPEGAICCTNTISPGDCPTDPHCCDPCDPSASECQADGHCGPGPGGCKDECCKRFGQGPCCGDLCCTPDQICDQSRGICCPPDPEAPPCNVPEEACKKEKDDIVENTMSDCNTGGGDQFSNAAGAMADDGIQIMACSFSASTFERSRLYADCPQRPSDALCEGGQGCDGSTLRCKQCIDSRTSARRAVGANDAARWGTEVDLRRSARWGKGKVKPAELRRLVQRSDRRFKRAAATIFDALHAPVQAALPLPGLAAAIDGYRREVVRLRRQLDNGDGGRPQKLALTALDETAAMLGAYRAAALAETTAGAEAAVTRGAKRARRARTASRRARQALGCGPERC